METLQAVVEETEKKAADLRANYENAWTDYRATSKTNRQKAVQRYRHQSHAQKQAALERKASEEEAANKAADEERIKALATQMAQKMIEKQQQQNLKLQQQNSQVAAPSGIPQAQGRQASDAAFMNAPPQPLEGQAMSNEAPQVQQTRPRVDGVVGTPVGTPGRSTC